jgi:hypothetical protein
MPPSRRSSVPQGRRSSQSLNGSPCELHREVRHAVRIDRELVDRNDVRVLELSGHLRFGDEAVPVERLARVVLVEPLQRDLPEEVSIRRRVHVAHAAASELTVDHQMRGRRDLLRRDHRGRQIGCCVDGDRLDDANELGSRFGGLAHAVTPPEAEAQSIGIGSRARPRIAPNQGENQGAEAAGEP